MNAHLHGCLLGGALGDALGLPMEGLGARRIARRLRGPLRPSFFLGRNMVSDDTEHAVMTALSLIEEEADPARFARRLARRLRWWMAALPAGIGLATARSIIKLWLGWSPDGSGVESAGNGPTMRAPVIGVWFAEDPGLRKAFVEASTLLTHTDPRALEAAQVVAGAAVLACAGETDADHILESLQPHLASEDFLDRWKEMRAALAAGETAGALADRIGRKRGYVSGFAPDSTAVALYAWLRHRGDFTATVEAVIRAGGDTDSVAAVAGALAGIDVGPAGIPDRWKRAWLDWPIRPESMAALAAGKTFPYPVWPLALLRNLGFLIVVLGHGLRRLLPF